MATENKILSSTTSINFIPKIEKKDLLILDSIRFAVAMIDYSYEQLFYQLLKLSIGTKTKNLPSLFMHGWSIIDCSRRLIKLYSSLSNDNSIIKTINYVNQPRNTYQHLDERIFESLLKNNLPFYGLLNWSYNEKELQQNINCVAISGIYHIEKFQFQKNKYESSEILTSLYLETTDKKERIKIDLLKLKSDLKNIISRLENSLNKQFSENNLTPVDWKKRRDVIFTFRNKTNSLLP